MKEVESLREEKDRLLCDVQVLHDSYQQLLRTAETLSSSLDEAIDENMLLSSLQQQWRNWKKKTITSHYLWKVLKKKMMLYNHQCQSFGKQWTRLR